MDAAPTRILFVCTANRCRSPFAEAIARRAAGSRSFVVASAGFEAEGYPTPDTGIRVAEERGLDLADHRSRRLDRATLSGWDAILTMSREHARELVVADPDLWPRVSTLRRFRRRLDGRRLPRHMALGAWLDATVDERSRTELVGMGDEDDVADPIGAPAPEWRAMADLLDDQIGAILDAISPREGAPPAPSPAP